MGENNVSSLEELALEVSFKEILSNLVLCPDHRPKEKKLKWLPFSSLLSTNPCFKSEQLIAIVRSRLDKYLVGTMGDKIRRKYVIKFYECVTNYGWKLDSHNSEEEKELDGDKEANEECLVDLWAFLDCVLDDSFKELETYVALPGCEPNAKVIEIIAKRSPLLETLELDFVFMKEGIRSEILRPVIQSLGSLEHLVNLSISLLNDDDQLRPGLLSRIGTACPSLSKLEVLGNGDFSNKEIYGLLLGEQAYNQLLSESEEPIWLDDSKFSRLQVPKKYLSPICSTLRELSLHTSSSKMYRSSAVFILRHLKLLEKLNLPLPTPVAIKSLHELSSFQLEFEKHREQALPCRFECPPQLNSKSSFSGPLSSTSINGVDPFDKEMLLAIGFLCPLLQEASFHAMISDELISPDELETVLKKWPKLTKITLLDFQSEYVMSILKVFGGELMKLQLIRCKFGVRQLLSCPKLEILRIHADCTLLDDFAGGMDAPLNQSTLLPHLKELYSHICLGNSSHLFENKSTLLSLHLCCCHIGCQEKGSKVRPITVASRSDWNRVHQMWPRLEHLSIDSCVGLTWAMLVNLVPKFAKLKSISLPYEIRDPRLLNQYSRQNHCVKFWFQSSPMKKCPFDLF